MPEKKEPTTIEFQYTATDRRNNKVNGEFSAASMPIAKASLQAQGLTNIKIKKKSFSFFKVKTHKNQVTKGY